MNERAVSKLLKLGWERDWLLEVLRKFRPKKKGKYKIRITDLEDLSQDPETGIYLDTAFFDDEIDLSEIHYFFEGFAYVITVAETDEEVGRGIIDGAPFEELEEFEGVSWTWQHDAVDARYGQRTWLNT